MTAIVKGSLSHIAKKEGTSLAETFLNVDMICLVDTSGSMSIEDGPGRISRWNQANNHLEAIQNKFQGKIALICFDSFVEYRPTGSLRSATGSTDLTAALEFIKVADGIGIELVLISDGYPDNMITALNVARSFTSKINTIHCGDEMDTAGKAFLADLAHKTGGKFQKTAEPGDIIQEVTLLLGG